MDNDDVRELLEGLLDGLAERDLLIKRLHVQFPADGDGDVRFEIICGRQDDGGD